MAKAKTIVRWALGGVAAFFVIGLIGMAIGVDKKKESVPATPGRAASTVAQVDAAIDGAPLAVTAGEIFDDYTANAVAADARYLNKRLRVGAVVGSVQGRFVELFVLGNHTFMAEFRSDERLASLKLSDEIIIECKGTSAHGVPALADCVLSDVSVPPTPTRGSIDDRRALVKKIKGMGFVARATGTDETTLELTSKPDGCKLADLTSAVRSSGYAMFYVGFTKLRCLDGDSSVELVDGRGGPTRDVGLTARKLFVDYEENEVSADIKYKGKALRVSGKISRIGKDALNSPFVDLATENRFEGVLAKFSSEATLVTLKRGQQVAVRCYGAGLMMGSPILADCVLE